MASSLVCSFIYLVGFSFLVRFSMLFCLAQHFCQIICYFYHLDFYPLSAFLLRDEECFSQFLLISLFYPRQRFARSYPNLPYLTFSKGSRKKLIVSSENAQIDHFRGKNIKKNSRQKLYCVTLTLKYLYISLQIFREILPTRSNIFIFPCRFLEKSDAVFSKISKSNFSEKNSSKILKKFSKINML